jgi:aspartyl-tRNA(Asn)/glutamyl-tRNA(Gln) amidotransferase subunit A
VRLPEAPEILPTFGVTQRAEALHVHREAGLYPARADEYGADVRGRLELASTEDVADYLRAAARRERVRAAFRRLFAEVDVLLTPVGATTASPIETDRVEHLGEVRDIRDLLMPYTTPQDLAGLPACAFRAGFDEHGLPIGVQLTGAQWDDARVLGAAHAVFEATSAVQERWPAV